MNRQTLTKIHLLLASFIFPVALMFLVTGSFYTWGIKGSYDTEQHMVALTAPLGGDKQAMASLVETELTARGLDLPSGGYKVKKAGTSYLLEWTGSQRDVVLEPTEQALVAKLTIKETSWYRNLVQLHKAKGGTLFKVYAAVLAGSLFLLLLSGFIMAWQIPKYRAMALACSSAGILVFVAAVSLS